MKIDDKKIPAEYFVPEQGRIWDTEVESYRKQLLDLMAKDDGYITVIGSVRERIPPKKDEPRPPAWWVDGRAIHGVIKVWPAK